MPKRRTVVNASLEWLISILWKTAEASNSQIRSMVVPKSFYIATGNDIIGYFRSATNSVNANGATANFSAMKYCFSITSENATASNFKICNHVTAFISQPRTMPPATSGRQQIE